MEQSTINQQQLFIKIALSSWDTYINRADKLFASLSDEQLQVETAPGRNSGVYLLGHLTAVHDALLPLLGLGEMLYPQLQDPFLNNPEKSSLAKPSIQELRTYWAEVNKNLSQHFNQFTQEDWLQKHKAVSPEDFEKEPHRNKLNVLVNRTNHVSYHLGQLIYLKK
jgi:uncharacterized damage-inducible protein DinB